MADKFKLNSDKILSKQFQVRKAGYNPSEVDAFLDLIIQDYQLMEDYVKASDRDKANLANKASMLQEQLNKAESELIVLKERVGDIKSNSDSSLNNLELIKRISLLEKALYRAGIDPNKIK